MVRKILLISLCLILTISCFVGCSPKDKDININTQIQQENTQQTTTEPKDENKPNYQYPQAQGVQSFKNEEVIAIKYVVYKLGFIDAFDRSFPVKSEGQIKETLTNYIDIFMENEITTFTHDKVKVVQKDKQNYVLESGKINGYNFKGIYTISDKDMNYVIVSCYIELDDDTSGIDAIVGQSFDLEDFS